MSNSEMDLLLGRLAVHFQVLTKEQISEAMRWRRDAGSTLDLGAFMVAEGFLSPENLAKLERARQSYLEKQGGGAPAAAPAAPAPEPAPIPQAPALRVAPVAPIFADAGPRLVHAAPEVPAPIPAYAVAPPAAGPQVTTFDPGAPDEGPLMATPAPATAFQIDAILAPGDVTPAAPAAQAWSPPVAASVAAISASMPQPPAAPVAPRPAPVAPRPAPVAAPAPSAPAPLPAPAPNVATAPMPAYVAPVFSSDPIVGPRAQLYAEPADGAFKVNYHASATLDDLLAQAAKAGASDLHLHSQAPLRLRIFGNMEDSSAELLPAERCRQLIHQILTPAQQEIFERKMQLDFAYSLPGIGRFRSNAYKQQRGYDAVFRIVPPNPPTLAELGLPASLERVIQFHQGMVLFTGPAGCGKSSTMAAFVRMINESRPDHILTVEDPIEYVHTSAACLVNQREVGPHTESFARALRAALREDPDVIVIGELRDLETISLALTAAETGHLVLGSLHTSSTVRTVNRLLGVFPPDQQAQIRTMVSESLRAVVSQRLVPRLDGRGRAVALEVLINTKAIGNLIRESKTFQIVSQLQTGGSQGMVLLDASLLELVNKGVISVDEARKFAEDPKKFS